ncbi:MAG: PhoX family protein [Sporichthyaceae bacterium]
MFEIHDDEASLNPSTEPHFAEVARARLSRRSVVAGGLASAAVFFAEGPAAASARPARSALPRVAGAGPLIDFPALAISTADEIRVPEGYTARPFIPWGTPIVAPYPEFVPGGNSADDQERQVGMHHDGIHYFPIGGAKGVGSRRGLLVLNHEYVDELHLATGLPTGTLPAATLESVRRSQAAHGVAVVEIEQDSKSRRWDVVRGPRNRRITANTPMQFSGPARGHRLLRTAADTAGNRPLGTFNNCGHGFTPWNTYLACEENFNGYFRLESAASAFAPEARNLIERYGVGGDRNRWATNDPRFRVSTADPNEPNRHGWVVEIDPFDAGSTPVKRTALGRLKHESAWVTEAKDGRVVVYMGDDQTKEFLYKYISAQSWRRMRARGKDPLDVGVLYVAKFNADGTGSWIPLVQGIAPLVAANGFADQGDVLVKTRQAATLVGATPMDRPEWVASNPNTRRIYLTCTNDGGNKQMATPANPRVPNPHGHIVCWQEGDGDYTGLGFAWNLLVLGGAGAGTGDGSTIGAEDAFGSADGLWCDNDGRLWIQTDGSQPVACNNQMLVADLASRPMAAPASTDAVPEIRRFLTGPKGCEITGVITTPDQRTMFVNVQHPGEGGGANASTWPNIGPTTLPRPATVIITKDDGGVIGS